MGDGVRVRDSVEVRVQLEDTLDDREGVVVGDREPVPVEERVSPPTPPVEVTVTLAVGDMDELPLPTPPHPLLGDTLVVRDPVEDREGETEAVSVPPN